MSVGLVNCYYYLYEVFVYIISGKWGYLEYDWIVIVGDFVYEMFGEGYILVVYEYEQLMCVFFIVKGLLVWFDEKGNVDGIFDVYDYIVMCCEYYDKIGVGVVYIDFLFC